jgi:hypothetical protein
MCWEEDNTAVEAALTDQQEENDSIKTEVMLLKSGLELIKGDIMRNEHYTRRNNIKIYDLAENIGESCVDTVQTLVRDKMKIEITPEQIAVTHRIFGRPNKPRPIIVRFEQHDVKFAVLKQRRQLNDTGVSIHEDLVKAVSDKLLAIKEKEECVDAWAWNGKILIKNHKDKIHKFTYGTCILDPFC